MCGFSGHTSLKSLKKRILFGVIKKVFFQALDTFMDMNNYILEFKIMNELAYEPLQRHKK